MEMNRFWPKQRRRGQQMKMTRNKNNLKSKVLVRYDMAVFSIE